MSNYNYPVRDAIQKLYPNSKVVAVNARYTQDYDEARYCMLRGLVDPKACKVKSHNTVIYMVASDSTNNLEEDVFYDIVTICPPPRECDRTDSLRRL